MRTGPLFSINTASERLGQTSEAAPRREQATRAVEGALARDPRTQEQGDELFVG